jgi:hypothetical protein
MKQKRQREPDRESYRCLRDVDYRCNFEDLAAAYHAPPRVYWFCKAYSRQCAQQYVVLRVNANLASQRYSLWLHRRFACPHAGLRLLSRPSLGPPE